MAHDLGIVMENGKTGTVWTAVAHVFCAVVGAGVLGLPNSLAWLGWVAGPICLLAFFAVSMWSSVLLSRLYLVDGVEFSRYHHAVQHIMGPWHSVAVAVFQMLNLVLSDIAYTITGAIAMETIARYLGTGPSKQWQFVLIMGAIELVFSQIPSLEEIWWVSALGTASSLGYVLIALGLGLAYSGNGGGSVGGRPGTSPANKAFGVLNSLGNIAFAFGFAQVLLEIQDTLKQPPKAEKTMQKAVTIAVTGALAFYMSSSTACYAALGDAAPGEVLNGFEMAPDWVMVVANICICIHMITAWQVWAQPVFETIESRIKYARGNLQQQQQQACAPAVHDPSSQSMCASGKAVAAGPTLPALAEADVEGGVSSGTVGSGTMSRDPSGTMSSLRSRHISMRGSGAMVVYNSAPLPDLVPHDWHPSRHTSFISLKGATTATAGGLQQQGGPAGLPPPSLRRRSLLAELGSRLGSQAMFHLDTGAANERVPLNDQGYLLPFWQRLLLRSAYVLLCTLVACVVPFFSAVVGLVGAITFFPLSIFFPFAMYIKVHKPRASIALLMKAVAALMLVVSVAATVGSFQNIIVSWSTYKLFS